MSSSRSKSKGRSTLYFKIVTFVLQTNNKKCKQHYEADVLVKHLEPSLFARVMQMHRRAAEAATANSLRRDHDRMLASAMRGDIDWHRCVIVEQLLTLQCPNGECRQPFADYGDGECIALTCKRCQTFFCGWCLQAFGKDETADAESHRHAVHCRLSESRPNIFPTVAQFVECHRKRRAQLVRDYLATKLPSNIDKAKLLDMCKSELAQLN